MGGGTPQTTNQKTLGKQTGQQSGTSGLNPYAPAQGTLNSILSQAQGLVGQGNVSGAEQGALGGLQNTSGIGAGYAPQMQGLVGNLFGGGGYGGIDPRLNQAYDTSSSALAPWAMGQHIGSNPYTQGLLDTIGNQVQNQVGDQFAQAGRSFSGQHAKALGMGITQAEAPILFGQYNNDVGNMFNANSALQNAGYGTANALNASTAGRLGAQAAAPGAIDQLSGYMQNPYQQTLSNAQYSRQIPMQQLQSLQNLLLPIAQGFGTNNTSGMSRSTDNTNMRQTMMPATNPMQTAIGAGLGAAGLLMAPMTGGLSLGAMGGMGGGSLLGGLLGGR